METILTYVNLYKDLSILCAVENNEKKNLLNMQKKRIAYDQIMIAIQKYGVEVQMQTLTESINLAQGEQAND